MCASVCTICAREAGPAAGVAGSPGRRRHPGGHRQVTAGHNSHEHAPVRSAHSAARRIGSTLCRHAFLSGWRRRCPSITIQLQQPPTAAAPPDRSRTRRHIRGRREKLERAGAGAPTAVPVSESGPPRRGAPGHSEHRRLWPRRRPRRRSGRVQHIIIFNYICYDPRPRVRPRAQTSGSPGPSPP